MMISGDPEHEAHAKYKRAFGSDEVLAVAIPVEDALGLEWLRRQDAIVEAIESIAGVQSVDALSTESEVFADDRELVVRSVRKHARDTAMDAAASTLFRERVATHPIWSGWLVSQDLRTVALQIELDDSDAAMLNRNLTLSQIEGVLDSALTGGEYFLAGHPFMKMEISTSIGRDLARLMPITIAVMAIVLLFATGSLPVGGAAISCVLLSGIWMVGAMGWSGLGLTALSNAAPTILLALATAYFLHLASAYQRRASKSRELAARGALSEVFLPTWIAVATTAVGYGSLSLSSVPIVQQFGLALAIGVVAAGVVGTFVFPAILVVLAPAPAASVFRDDTWLTNLLFRIALLTSRVPRPIVFVSIAIGVLLAVAALDVDVDSSAPNRFAEDSRFRKSADFYRSRLSGDVVETVYLAGSPGAFFQPDVLRRMMLFEVAASELPAIDDATSIADVVARVNWVFEGEGPDARVIPESAEAVAQLMLLYESSAGFEVLSDFTSTDQSQAKILLKADVRSSAESSALKRDLRQLVERFLSDVSEPYSVVSTEMLLSKSADVIVVEQLSSALLAIGLILLMIAIAFRSALSSALMLVPNLTPIAVCVGAMSLLGVPLSDATSIIGATAIGIAVDSTVHILSAAERSRGEGGGSHLAVLGALMAAGRPVVISSVVVIVGFSILLFSDFKSVAELGLLTSLTMLCCLFADLVVLPAQIVLFSSADKREALLLHVNGGLVVASGELDKMGARLSQVVDADITSLPARAGRVQALPSGRAMNDVPLRKA